ncbi:MAG: hypothetical protein AB7O43_10845 [Hyphomicrobiaceae bacterium]
MSVKTLDGQMGLLPGSGNHSVWAKIRLMLQSIADGLRMAHEYKDLTAQGVHPEVACRRVFEDVRAR